MFSFSSIEHYHAQLKEGKVTCVQAVEYYLQRIRSEQRLNAFVQVYSEEALARARQLDEKRSTGAATGRLHGIVVAIKDVICYKDHPVTASSRMLENFRSIYSATAIQRLLDEEAIIIGHTNCDEFAMGSTNENSVYGPVRNAIDETRVPGGSSGGSAVAVQAKLCMVSLGSDTGGSVRQPADFCGVIGLKPGYGRISRYGLIAFASSFDNIGIFGKDVDDIRLMLEVMSGPDAFDSTVIQTVLQPIAPESDKKYRFAFFEDAFNHPGLDPEIGTTVKGLAEKLKAKGHDVNPVAFNLLDYIVPAYYVLSTAEASSNLSRYDGIRYGYQAAKMQSDLTAFYKQNRSEGFGKEVKRRIMLGTFVLSAGYYDAYFTRAQKVRKLLTEKTKEIFTKHDFIILPVSPSTAFKVGEKMKDPIAMYLADIYTVMANLVGIPAISLPLFTHKNGMPFGLQVMANSHDELTLLDASRQLMQQFGSHKTA
ncbi:MAG TPA: Asp-tRNA(Asn)/Glu-tRNA(Gln) amidotransferase subunit GatA [Chitinophagaceae bacterium]|nr:Asp-tRNA(Asn)/Glu-tRNA(Gln) amidotransferase subunit GatA [Chitinophagaceae bacterium]